MYFSLACISFWLWESRKNCQIPQKYNYKLQLKSPNCLFNYTTHINAIVNNLLLMTNVIPNVVVGRPLQFPTLKTSELE